MLELEEGQSDAIKFDVGKLNKNTQWFVFGVGLGQNGDVALLSQKLSILLISAMYVGMPLEYPRISKTCEYTTRR